MNMSIQILPITLIFFLTSCYDKAEDPIPDKNQNKNENFTNIDPIPPFFESDVVLATGINFNSGDPLVLNPATGEKLPPLTDSNSQNCNISDVIIYSDGRTLKSGKNSKKESDCNTRIINPNQELASAILNSDKIIDGKIRVNGEIKDARFIISVTALYKGSNCAYYIVNGNQYNFCSDTISQCNGVAPVMNPDNPGYAGSTNGSYRRAVRKVCRQFSSWKDNDCNYLKTRYKTGALGSIYPTRYKQYIWKTCNRQQSSWGTCPPPISKDQTISECINPIESP